MGCETSTKERICDSSDKVEVAYSYSGVGTDGLFRCPHCSKCFLTAKDLDEHEDCMAQPQIVAQPIIVGASIGCTVPGCGQRFLSQRALEVHLKFMHDGQNLLTEKDTGYELVYEFNGAKEVASKLP